MQGGWPAGFRAGVQVASKLEVLQPQFCLYICDGREKLARERVASALAADCVSVEHKLYFRIDLAAGALN